MAKLQQLWSDITGDNIHHCSIHWSCHLCESLSVAFTETHGIFNESNVQVFGAWACRFSVPGLVLLLELKTHGCFWLLAPENRQWFLCSFTFTVSADLLS